MEKEENKFRWLLYENKSNRFPYSLFIEKEKDKFINLFVQDKWPGPGKKVFCLRGKETEPPPGIEPADSCRIVSVKKYSKKLTVILDRKTRKRCYFIMLKKKYKNRAEKHYEQIFWVTQSSASKRRPGAYIPSAGKHMSLTVVKDTRERYGYKFENAKIINENLPAGDYGLRIDGKIVAVAERKTLDNLLHAISTYDVFKMNLQEMNKRYKYNAVVFESPYADFINPSKLPAYPAAFVAKIIADMTVSFPSIQFVFCSNRKTAKEWVHRWFLRISREYGKDLFSGREKNEN